MMLSRRTLFVGLASLTLAAASLAGCSSSSPQTSQASGTVEVFSWWTAGGEADGLAAIIAQFKTAHPQVDFINAAEKGGGGTKAREALQSRMSQNQPPDSFQVHGGKELISTWVKPTGVNDASQSKMESLDSLFTAQGWKDKFPQELLDIVSYGGNIYSVPVNIHRGNALFYNVKVLANAGVAVPTTMAEFQTAATTLKQKGIVPVAIGAKDPWTVTMIFEDFLLARGGADFVRAYFAGEKTADDPIVSGALDDTKAILAASNTTDSGQLEWDAAAQKVAAGTAAFTFMGDWAKGYFESKGLVAEVDFDVRPAFGTDGKFIVITDTFGLPKGAPSRDNAVEFLKLVASVEAQDAFNVKKGSIPARLDADLTKYDSMAKRTIADFKAAQLVPSLAHGSAAAADFKDAVDTAIGQFITTGDSTNVLGVLRDRYASLK